MQFFSFAELLKILYYNIMPAEITATGEDKTTMFQMAFPGYSVPIRFYNPEENTNAVLVVCCGEKDYASDIFLFEEPEGLTPADGEALLEHCDEDSFVTQLDHEDACSFTALDRAKLPTQLAIRHTCSMSAS